MNNRWDIFCTVIDNFGDVGIAWRLARQLARDHKLRVCLWVDDLVSFSRIRPEIDPNLSTQSLGGVEVRRWTQPLTAFEPADVVIEALACYLPVEYVEAMAARARPTVWINLEYLSAEDWVLGCHTLPSPHPRLPLVKYFFFPGWSKGTGGLLREQRLLEQRQSFLSSEEEKAAFWRRMGVPPPEPGETQISLFSYENAAVKPLLQGWAMGDDRIRCMIPEGRNLPMIQEYFGGAPLQPGDSRTHRQLTIQVLTMMSQDDYDRLLWASDCNFVRGEDSFVRAQWACKPMIWQAYRQEESAHWPKIEAFLGLYCAGLSQEAAAALRRLWEEWNREGIATEAWPAFWGHAGEYREHAQNWCSQLVELGDLAENLVHFCKEKL